MMNIMGGARPSEVASKNTWQGVQGFPSSQQPDITNAGSIFGVNGMFGGAPTASQSFVSPGNVASLAGGKGGVNFGSLFGGNNGGGSYSGENVGYGPPAGVGIDQYGYGVGGGNNPMGPSAVDTGLVSPSTAYDIESGVASMFGFVPDGKGGFVPSKGTITSPLSIFSHPFLSVLKGVYNGITNNDLMSIESQMTPQQAFSITHSPEAYGEDAPNMSLSEAMDALGAGSYGGGGVSPSYGGGGYGMPGSEGVGGIW